MKNSLANVVVAAVVGAIAALIAASSGLGVFGGAASQALKGATINLDQIGPTCYITTNPQTIPQKRNGDIEWTVENRCEGDTHDAEVTIAFKGDNPFPVTCVLHNNKKIKCKVKSDAAYKFYPYSVSAPGAVTEDPEIEIVQ